MRRFLHLFGKLAAAVLPVVILFACQPDTYPTTFAKTEHQGGALEAEYVEMPVGIGIAGEEETKGSLLTDSESKGSGVLILVYRSATGQLDRYYYFTQAELNSQSTNPLKIAVPLVNCDFYVLGNLMAVKRSDASQAGNLMEALGADFPVSESALEALAYRLDGGNIDATWRRETMAEVAVYGIPYQCIAKNVNVSAALTTGIPGSSACVRLFSKINITIDHKAFDGGNAANVDWFKNKSLFIRQTNCRMLPFSTAAVKAEAEADLSKITVGGVVQNTGDYDAAMANSTKRTFTFYVPENMQGTQTGISSSSQKTSTNTGIAAAIRSYGSYVEFSGTLDKAAGGFGGDVVYRFFLGANSTTDFNLQRGKKYDIELGFTADGLFNPYWKVNADLVDSRMFAMTADPSFSTDISSVRPDRTMAVRKSRDGFAYVYMNPAGALGGANSLLNKDNATSTSFHPASIADCAWFGNLMVPGTADYNWLADRGMYASWDKVTGKLTIKVSDTGKFNSHIGESRNFTLQLLPNGATTDFGVKLLPDMTLTVADGLSLTDEFYLGQKRHVTVSGFSGSTVKYAAVQKKVGSAPSAALNSNVQWKPSNSTSVAFPTCAVDGSGNVVLNPSNAVYDSQTYSGGLDIYAFYPNRFQSSHSGWDSTNGRIVFFTEDWWNDSLEAEIRVSEPRLQTFIPDNSDVMILPIDGTPLDCGGTFGYQTFDGSSPLAKSSFDATLYDAFLKFIPDTPAATSYMDCVTVDQDSFKIYCGKTVSNAGNLEDYSNWSAKGVTQFTSNRTYILKGNPATGLFPNEVHRRRIQFSRLVLGNFSGDGKLHFYAANSDNLYIYGYFANSNNNATAYVPTRPHEEDNVFGFYIEYNFQNSDLSTLDPVMLGSVNPYTSSHGETFKPVFDVTIDTKDTGSGGIFGWLFDESKQVKQDSHGEWVPGGLIVPYGAQSTSFTYENRYDHRTFSIARDVKFRYDSQYCIFAAAVNGRANAQVFAVTPKHVKYLMAMPESLPIAQRTQVLKFAGSYSYGAGFVEKAYPYNGANAGIGGTFYVSYPSSPKRLPFKDFQASYVPPYSTSAWSASKMSSFISGNVGSPSGGGQYFTPATYACHCIVFSNRDGFTDGFDDSYLALNYNLWYAVTISTAPHQTDWQGYGSRLKGRVISSTDTWFANVD